MDKGFKRHIISQLNGKKIFILGNHDGKTKQPKSYLSLGFEQVYAHDLSITIDNESVLLCHYPYNPMLSRWQILWYKFKNFWRLWRRNKGYGAETSTHFSNKGIRLLLEH